MNIDLEQIKNAKEIFERLSKGQFICSNSVNSQTKALYTDLENHFEMYKSYFKHIGLLLKWGEGYFYFARKEADNITKAKLEKNKQWINYLALMSEIVEDFGPGARFKVSDIEAAVNADDSLKNKMDRMMLDKTTYRDKIMKIVNDMVSYGYAECINSNTLDFQTTTAINHIIHIVKQINPNQYAYEISE